MFSYSRGVTLILLVGPFHDNASVGVFGCGWVCGWVCLYVCWISGSVSGCECVCSCLCVCLFERVCGYL